MFIIGYNLHFHLSDCRHSDQSVARKSYHVLASVFFQRVNATEVEAQSLPESDSLKQKKQIAVWDAVFLL